MIVYHLKKLRLVCSGLVLLKVRQGEEIHLFAMKLLHANSIFPCIAGSSSRAAQQHEVKEVKEVEVEARLDSVETFR